MAFPTARDALYGNPIAADHQPDKAVLRQYLEGLEALIGAGTIKGFADAVADLPDSDNTTGDLRIVTTDPTEDGGVYRWSGSAWVLVAALPSIYWDDAYARLSQDWAEGTLPGGAGTKSAKEHSEDAGGYADLTAADAEQTAEDRAQTTLDRAAALASATQAGVYRDQAATLAAAAGAPSGEALPTLPDVAHPADSYFRLLLGPGIKVYRNDAGAWTDTGIWERGPKFDSLDLLIADESTTYGGDGTIIEAEGCRLLEVLTDEDRTNAGGVKLKVLPGADGRYPALAFGNTAAAFKRAWQVAGKAGVSLGGRVWEISGLTDTGADIHLYGPGEIKMPALSIAPMWVNTGGSTYLRDVTVNGNRAGQTTRQHAFQQIGGDLIISKVGFKGTVSSGFRVGGTMGNLIVESSTWEDMAEHGGSLGQTSFAGYIVATSVKKLRIAFNTVKHAIPSAAGYSPAGFFISVNEKCPVDALFNEFENMGQNVAGNVSGCLDFYTNAHAGTVIGNRAVNSYWMPWKLQIGDRQIVEANRIEGVHATAGGGMALLQNTRSYGALLKYALVGSNYIDLGEGIDLPAIILQGDSDYHSDGIILRDMIVPRCGKFLTMEKFQHVEILSPICDAQESATGCIEIKNTDQGAGAPTTCRVVIRGGRLPAENSSAVFARTNVTNLDLTVDGVEFRGGGAGSPIVTMRNGKALRFLDNDFDTGSVTQLDAQTLQVAQINGNRGPVGTLGVSAIGDLDYGYNPGCWDHSGSTTYDPPSIAAGAVITTTVTVTGASPSLHEAVAHFNQVTNGLIITAWVSGANTVTVQMYNPTGSAIDLASGTLSARARRRLALAA